MGVYFGSKLKYLRKQKGLLSKEVAKSIGVSAALISLFESGEREPSVENLSKLADYFGVSEAYFFGVSETQEKQFKDLFHIVHIPIYNNLKACVPGVATASDLLGYHDLPAVLLGSEMETYFGIQVETKEMEPRICVGDILVLAYTTSFKSEDVVAVLIGEIETGLFTYKETADGVILMPSNLSFAPHFFRDKNEMYRKGVRVVGKVVHQLRKYN